jgi:uncharacterized membrane protein YhaH (DUF805 family)
MRLLFSFKEPIGRGIFAILFILSMFIYGGAFYFIQESNVLLIFLRLILVLGSLAIFITILVRRLIDIGKKSSEIYLLLIPIYNIYILFLLFTKSSLKK